jgi:hypothetical protein
MISVPTPPKDLESQQMIDIVWEKLHVFSGAPGETRIDWSWSLGAWALLLLVFNILPVPMLVLFVLNCAFLLYNIEAVVRVGRRHTPTFVYVIIALQVLVCLQYGYIALKAIFRW